MSELTKLEELIISNMNAEWAGILNVIPVEEEDGNTVIGNIHDNPELVEN